MSNIPSNLRYTKTHEWVRKESDGSFTLGITDHAQSLLGDIVFVDAPKVGNDYAAGKECCVIESVKAASDVYMPMAGKVKAVNDKITTAPNLVNADPYNEGWLFKFEATSAADFEQLLDAAAYTAVEQADTH